MADEKRLANLNIDPRETDVNVRGYSRFVRIMRIMMPLLALIIVGLLFLWPQMRQLQHRVMPEMDLKALEQAAQENRLTKPVFNTVDDKGRPLTITADEAVQDRHNESKVQLESPKALLKGEKPTSDLEITADQGQYNQKDGVMILNDNVQLKDGRNNTLETESLTADITKGEASSQSPATLTTPQGVVKGSGVTVKDKGEKTIFHGPAKAVINP